MDDAVQMIDRAGLKRDWTEVIENVDATSLDEGHVQPNLGYVVLPGVWFPPLNG